MYCRSCSYPLAALASRACPECGRGFDPSDERTFAAAPGRVRVEQVTRVAIALTTAASLTCLALSIWPGVLGNALFWAVVFSVLWVPGGAILAFGLLVHFLWCGHVDGRRRRRVWPGVAKRDVAIVPLLVAVTLALLALQAPRRVAFLTSQAAFERMAAQAIASPAGWTRVDARLGIYRIDAYATDHRGGVYFRVHSGMAGIGLDVTSYGFAFRPDPQAPPFGAADYHLVHLAGDWYSYSACDDW